MAQRYTALVLPYMSCQPLSAANNQIGDSEGFLESRTAIRWASTFDPNSIITAVRASPIVPMLTNAKKCEATAVLVIGSLEFTILVG